MITLSPYNPKWPAIFVQEAAQIKQELNEQCLAVHHVGSTAVPGLVAKPIVDIIVVIPLDRATLRDPFYQTIISLMQNLGYTYKNEYNIPHRLYFNKRDDTAVNLHIYPHDHPEIELNISFRDYLQNHPGARGEYAQLKQGLVADEHMHSKNNSAFTGYSLSKDAFIRSVLLKAGYNRLRLMKATHYIEWDAVKHLRQKYFFDNVPMDDPYLWTWQHPDHVHLVLYKGVEIIGYAHIQLWPRDRAILRIIVINEDQQQQSYGGQFLMMIERWLHYQCLKTLHTDASPTALKFYLKYDYQQMLLDDPDGYERDPQDTTLAKEL